MNRPDNARAHAKDNAKFLGKHLTSLAGAFFLLLAGKKINKENYKKRVLVVFGGGIGDVVKASIVCGYLKEYLKEYDVYYLMPYKFKLPYAKENIFYNYRKAKKDPFYYFELINRLRRIGFSEVMVLFPLWEGFLSGLANDIKPDRAFCYKETEPNSFYHITSKIYYLLRYFQMSRRTILIKVASGWDKKWPATGWDEKWPFRTFPSEVGKQAYFISQAINTIRSDVTLDERGLLPLENPRTEVMVDPEIEKEFLTKLKEKYGLGLENCCLIGLGSSIPYKNWQVEKFVDVAKFLSRLGLKIGTVDQAKDAELIGRFSAGYGDEFYNLGVEADLQRLFVLIKYSFMVMSNDTSFVHLAIALRVPSVCVIFHEQLGEYSFYGYEHINKWVFDPRPGALVSSVETEAVIKACQELVDYKRNAGEMPEKFKLHFGTDYDYA